MSDAAWRCPRCKKTCPVDPVVCSSCGYDSRDDAIAATPSMKNPYYDEQAAAEPPRAITGTWSDMEQTAWLIYKNADRDKTEWALAEAVLVLLGAVGCDTSTDGARWPSGGGDAA